jgi:signal peptidase I
MVLIYSTLNLKFVFNKLMYLLISLLFCVNGIICIYFFLQVFGFSTFRIPSNSMAPELIAGDNVLVAKPVLVARFFNVFASLCGKQTDIWRVPGFRTVNRNDVLVFNFPHPNNWSKIEMHILKYYIKRCIALPGDTLLINNGYYRVSGVNENLGNWELQQRLSGMSTSEIDPGIFSGFPYDSIINWNIKDFDPLYIPKKGDVVVMNRINGIVYRKIIEWEQHGKIRIEGNKVFLNKSLIKKYEFEENYYFMAGDRVLDSQDSRYWGLLPEEYIVGKAWIVWKSIDKYTGAFRWPRFLKEIK